MDRTRWKEIDAVLEQALELEPGDRAGALARMCAGDEELRRRVDALLGQEGAAEQFLEASALDYLALQLGDGAIGLMSGQQIGRFRIEQLIGEGGMGEVYLAEDPLLGRKVAIKLLPAHFNASAERVSRFEREARAAGSLSHENIIRVFDVGEFDGRHYIVTEHVAGENLRERMAGKPMNALEAVSIARKIAAALVAAHDAGVVHRDIKPENVMVQRDGIVKVLDFSLALLVGDELQERASGEAAVQTAGSEYATRFGAVMGTLRYMSPEQARGEVVDHRTDLFSLGVVMYELLMGQAPFTGKSADAVRTAILEHEPAFNLSSRWQRIVRRALHKSKTERYQTARELHDDLKALLDAPAWLTRRAMIASGFAAAASAAGGIWYLTRGRGEIGAEPAPEIRTLGLNAIVEEAAVSPDGRRIAFAQWVRNRRRLKVWDVTTGDSVEILPPDFDLNCYFPSFTPEGRSIYFLAAPDDEERKSLYRIPYAGGAPTKLMGRSDSPAAVSPDGRRLAVVQISDDGEESALVTMNEDGGDVKTLVTRRKPNRIVPGSQTWSPDGGRIAFAAGSAGSEFDHFIHQVPAEGGAEQLLSRHGFRRLGHLEWLGDGRGMGLMVSHPGDINYQIWYLAFAGDRLRGLTADPSSSQQRYATLTATSSGKELLAIRWANIFSLWVMPAFDSSRATQLVPGGETAGRYGIAWTPDGQIVYAGGTEKLQQLRIVSPAGGDDRSLMPYDKDNDGPAITRDGRYLVFCSNRGPGQTNIWRLTRHDGSLLRLTSGTEDVEPDCSPDGQWVVYVAKEPSGAASIWKVSIEGGQPLRLTTDCGTTPSPAISPDGKRLAYFRLIFDRNEKRLEIIPFDHSGPSDARPSKSFTLPNTAYFPRWSHDGRSILHLQAEGRVANLWALSLESGERKQMTRFSSEEISRFALSFDGKQVAVCRIKTIRDVVRISNFT